MNFADERQIQQTTTRNRQSNTRWSRRWIRAATQQAATAGQWWATPDRCQAKKSSQRNVALEEGSEKGPLIRRDVIERRHKQSVPAFEWKNSAGNPTPGVEVDPLPKCDEPVANRRFTNCDPQFAKTAE